VSGVRVGSVFCGGGGGGSSLSECFQEEFEVEGGLIRNAPHCLELSYWSQGWYARCYGWAMECAASFAMQS
jgi:hypothetical protein